MIVLMVMLVLMLMVVLVLMLMVMLVLMLILDNKVFILIRRNIMKCFERAVWSKAPLKNEKRTIKKTLTYRNNNKLKENIYA